MEDEKSDDAGPSPKRKRTSSAVKLRPNFFVAVQVSNPVIHREVNTLQKIITSKKPLYKSVLIKLITLHITLCTLHLAGNGDIRKAKSALKKLETDMKDMLVKDPISLKFKGIGSFKNEVVFAKIEPGEPLSRMADLHTNLVKVLKDEGLIVTDKFEPHLTIMKMSKDWTLRKKKVFKIPKDLYEEKNEMEFGDQPVGGVQLLSMGYRAANTYYNCYHHLDLGTYSGESEDHEDCCGVKSVIPNGFVELDTETSDEDDEEMFVDSSEVLEEIMIVEASEAKDAREYLEGLEVEEEEVFLEALEFQEEESFVEVVEVHRKKVAVEETEVENGKVKLEASELQGENVDGKSSAVKMKTIEVDGSEVRDVKVFIERSELEDEKVNDSFLEVENMNIEEPEDRDENVNAKASTIQNGNLNVEETIEEVNAKVEGLGSEDAKTLNEVSELTGKVENVEGIKEDDTKTKPEISEARDEILKVKELEAQVANVNVEAEGSGVQGKF